MNSSNLPHIASRLFDQPLMIHPKKLEAILQVLGPRLDIEALSQKMGHEVPEQKSELVEGQRRKAGYVLARNVAIVPVYGTLVQRSGFLDAMSGIMSYQRIRTMLEGAMADSEVREIILDVDSPGGEVSGVFDLVDWIYEMRKEKRITAIANEAAYSAAYALASSAHRIVTPRTGGAGSVGVIATHVDQSQRDAANGYAVTHITAGDKKAQFSPHQPLSDDATAKLQSMVNDTYELFVETVARNRGMAASKVRDTKADVFIGKLATKYGLVDQVEAADKAVASVISNAQKRGGISMSEEKKAAVATAENTGHEQGTDQPNPQPAAATEAPKAEGKGDRAEVLEIMEACRSAGCADMAEGFIKEGLSASEAKGRLLSAGKIRDICQAAGFPGKADEFIKKGASVEQVRNHLFEAMVEHNKAQSLGVGADGKAKVQKDGGELDNSLTPTDMTATPQGGIGASWADAIQKVTGQLHGQSWADAISKANG